MYYCNNTSVRIPSSAQCETPSGVKVRLVSLKCPLCNGSQLIIRALWVIATVYLSLYWVTCTLSSHALPLRYILIRSPSWETTAHKLVHRKQEWFLMTEAKDWIDFSVHSNSELKSLHANRLIRKKKWREAHKNFKKKTPLTNAQSNLHVSCTSERGFKRLWLTCSMIPDGMLPRVSELCAVMGIHPKQLQSLCAYSQSSAILI